MFADDLGLNVVVVDTSNEIAGDGDEPHACIGAALRMQVGVNELRWRGAPAPDAGAGDRQVAPSSSTPLPLPTPRCRLGASRRR